MSKNMNFKIMEILKNPIINNSEIARQIGLTPTMFRNKLTNYKFNKFSETEILAIKKVLEGLKEKI